MEELKGAVLSQNHRCSHGVAQGARVPLIEMQPMTKFDKKALFLHFQFLSSIFAYNSTRVQQ